MLQLSYVLPLKFACFIFLPRYFFHSRVIGACPATTDCIVLCVNVRTTTTTIHIYVVCKEAPATSIQDCRISGMQDRFPGVIGRQQGGRGMGGGVRELVPG